ncbi:MAG: 2-hydroxyacid dehydrogenase [Pseudomonadota bacterium]
MPDRLLLLGSPASRYTDRLAASFDVTQAETQDAFAAALEEGAGIVGIAMFGHWTISPTVMDALPDLKVISNFGVGYDTIDAAEAASRGILVSHTPDVLNDEVADTALMLWLAVSRELLPSERWARSGDWETKGNYPLTRSIRNRTVGILGMGRIGQAIAETIQPFNPNVVYHTRSPKDVPYTHVPSLVDMARQSDVLIVITPGGAATRHLVNAEVIEALGPDGILINVARGTVIDEAAMTQALVSGKLGGAGLDVFDQEPKIPDALKSLDNVVLLPHVGSGSIETRQRMGDLVCDNLDQWKASGGVKTPVPECQALNG